MNSKRKLMLAITALTMSVTSAVAMSACGDKHKHSYSDDDWTVVTAPTCTEAGLESHKCQGCDQTETRPIAATGHAYSDDGWTLTTDPTCITKGEETRVCANDESHVEHRDVDFSDNHPYGNWTQTKDPTCLEEGEETRVCANDKTHVDHRPVATINHSPTEWDSDETYHWKKCTLDDNCTEISEKKEHKWDPALDEILVEPGDNTNGSKRRHCECGATKTSPIPMLSHVEHTYGDEWQKNASKHWKECTFDGCEEVLESIHDWNITTPATCDTAGSKVCKVCGYQTEIPALGHTWTTSKVVKTPATCGTAGEEGYQCTICGDFKDVTEIPALGHDYGEWIIDNPDATLKGFAVKYCANDKEHDHDIHLELPALNNTDYAVDEGESTTTYTLKSDETIVITVYKNLNVEKAIDVAVSNMDKVLSGEIVKTSKLGMDNKAPTDNTLTYEKGNNYIHITDEGLLTADYGGLEMFITKNADGSYFFPYKTIASGTGYINMDDPDYMTVADAVKEIYDGGGDPVANSFKVHELVGSLFPIIRDGNEISKFTPANLSVGAPFTLIYAEHAALRAKEYYGIENLIKILYTVAKTNPNNDFTENKSEPDENGITTYTFSFGYKGDEEGCFAIYSVEFKLDRNFVMVDATVENKGYTNKDWNENKQAYDVLNNFSYEDGKYVVTAGAKSLWVETYSVSQTRFEDGAKPSNPYTPEGMKISRFDITQIEEKEIYATGEYTISGVQTVNDNVGNSLDAVAGDDGSIMLRFVNVYPASANFFMDEVKLELYTADGKLIEELDSQYSDGNDGHVKARYNAADNILALSFWLAGDYQLKISTSDVEKVINLHIPFNAPTGFAADVYQYNEFVDKWSNIGKTYEVYEGQALALASIVDHPAYQTSDYTVTVKNAGGETVEGVISDGQYVEGIEGKEVRLFRAESAGVYTVILKSTHSGSNITASFTVTVKEAPDVEAMLDGEFTNEEEEVVVEFKTVDDVKQAVITMGEENPTTVSYTYNEETHGFTVTHVSGPDDKNFGFELSEAFNLYLTYEQEVSGIKTRVLISNSINDTLSGTYTTPENGVRMTLTASASGVYRITVVSGQYLYYDESTEEEYYIPIEDWEYYNYNLYCNLGEAGQFGQPADNAEIALVKGGSVEMYSVDPYYVYTFKIEYVGKLTPVTGVTLEGAEVSEGQTVTLTPEFTPENASVRTGKWTSSDETVATVDNSGVVTGVSAGTVTIQFTSDDGAFKATCTVTVTEFFLTPGSNSFPLNWGTTVDLKFKGEENTEYALIYDTGYACTFYSSDSGDIISKITTDENGEAYFTLYFNGYGYAYISIVKPVAVTGITLDKDSLESNELKVGESLDLYEYVTITPDDAIDKSFRLPLRIRA